jgi:hypothetical protein
LRVVRCFGDIAPYRSSPKNECRFMTRLPQLRRGSRGASALMIAALHLDCAILNLYKNLGTLPDP